MTSILSSPESRRLGQNLASMQREIDTLKAAQRQSQLGNSTLYGAIYIADPDGNVKGIVGEQADGSTGVVVTAGPPPPTPTGLSLTPLMAGVDLGWAGTFAQAKPLNFSHVNAYLSDAGPDFIHGPSNMVGTLSDAGTIPVAPLPSGTQWWARLVAVNTSVPPGESPVSVTVGPVAPSQVVAQDVLDGIVTEVKLANDAVTAAKIAAGAVGTGEIAGQAVTLSQLANGSVDATKLTDAAVTQPAIATNAVTANAIAANQIIAGKIAADAVTANTIAAGSVSTLKLAAEAVSADKIAANAVTAAAINALAVTADKVAANAINAGHITAGAVTAAKLAATLVLGTTIVAGASTTGARVQLNGSGIEAFRSNGMKTLDFDTGTGDMLIAGQYRSGDSGERIIIGVDGTQQFTNSSGGTSGRIANNGIDLIISGTPGGSSRTGVFNVNQFGAGVTYRNPANSTLFGEVNVQSGAVANNAAIVYVHADQRVSPGNGTQRFQVSTLNTSGNEIPSSIINLVAAGGNGSVLSPVENCGIKFDAGTVLCVTGDGGAFGPIKATAFVPSSSETVKENIGEVTLPNGRTSWDLIEGAPSLDWNYISEAADPTSAVTHGDGTRVLVRKRNPAFTDTEWEKLIDYDPQKWIHEPASLSPAALKARAQPGRRHKFPLAEDLHALCPDLVEGDPEDPGNLGADLRDAVGILWDATDMLIKRNRLLESALMQLFPLLSLPGRPQKGDVQEGVGAVVPGRTRRQLDASTGQIRGRIRDILNDRQEGRAP